MSDVDWEPWDPEDAGLDVHGMLDAVGSLGDGEFEDRYYHLLGEGRQTMGVYRDDDGRIGTLHFFTTPD